MGIFCELDIDTPESGFFVPGSTVSGIVRYSIGEKTSLKRIMISLKGTGSIDVDRDSSDDSDVENSEDYVNDATFVDLTSNKHTESSKQEYETRFTFRLPENIPSSLKFHKEQGDDDITCDISYKVRVEFCTSERFSFNKEFEKEIKVVSTAITPKLATQPMIYGERRKLFQLFRRKKSVVKIKATIQNSVLRPGSKVQIAYEVENETNLDISVRTRFTEVYKCYKSDGSLVVETSSVVDDLESHNEAIKKGETFSTKWEIDLPPELHSVENTKVLTRSYEAIITAALPKPHFDAHVLIPLQIGDWHVAEVYPEAGPSYPPQDPPPSYWKSIEELDSLNTNEDNVLGKGLKDL